MTIQEEMIRYRARNDLTQQQFAERINSTRQTVSAIEKGKVKPSRYLEAKIRLLFEEEENGSQY